MKTSYSKKKTHFHEFSSATRYKENVAFILKKFSRTFICLYFSLKTKAKSIKSKASTMGENQISYLVLQRTTIKKKNVLKRKGSLHAGIGSWYFRMSSEWKLLNWFLFLCLMIKNTFCFLKSLLASTSCFYICKYYYYMWKTTCR